MTTCILIHGFTGSPYEVEPLARHLRSSGYNVITPVLAGHEENQFRSDVQWTEWIASVEKVVMEICQLEQDVILCGFSMGGMIAIYLANRYPIKKLILLSPSAYYPNLELMWNQVRENGMTRQEGSGGTSDDWQRYMQKVRRTPLRWVWQFHQLVRFCRSAIDQVQIPTLIIQGEQDNLVPAHSAHYLYEAIPTEEKYLYFLPQSPHIICHGCEQAEIFRYVDQFLRNS